MRPRLRELGLRCGRLAPGGLNSITDVAGLRVGHLTLCEGASVRSGVTAIVPNAGLGFREPLAAGIHVLNGAGEMSGLAQVQEWGLVETPILLTNTMSVGVCYQACCRYLSRKFARVRQGQVVIPVVGECDDSYLHDASRFPLREEHVWQALESASRDVAEGSVGAGTGMMAFDFKAGIGTSSRVTDGYTTGALVLSNFGQWENLRVDGHPVADLIGPALAGQELRRGGRAAGSLIVVLATDAPLLPHQLRRLAQRAGLGAARVGSTAAHGSGEIFLAFSTTQTAVRRSSRVTRRVLVYNDEHLDPLFQAAVEATEEAILNALCVADEMVGWLGHRAAALPTTPLQALLQR